METLCPEHLYCLNGLYRVLSAACLDSLRQDDDFVIIQLLAEQERFKFGWQLRSYDFEGRGL